MEGMTGPDSVMHVENEDANQTYPQQGPESTLKLGRVLWKGVLHLFTDCTWNGSKNLFEDEYARWPVHCDETRTKYSASRDMARENIETAQ